MTKPPAAGPAPDGTGLLLWQVSNRWQAAQRAALKPLGLTHVQYLLLATLAQFADEGTLSQRELAEYAATDPMMTSQVVRVLEANRWVLRQVQHDDRRAWALSVTRSGAALAKRANRAVEKCDAEFFASLGSRGSALRSALLTLRDS